MSNLHRIIWIDSQIRGGRYPNCTTIARHFEISPRQASRDIEYLRDSLGAPVEFSPKHNGYCYPNPTFVLPAHFLSQEEKEALGYLAFQYRNLGGEAARLAGLFTRLTGERAEGREGKAVPVFNPRPGEAKAYTVLNQAMAQQNKVQMEYVNAGGHRSRRVFCPYQFFCLGDKGYVAGYCEFREDIRTFKLERIRDLEILGGKFQIVPWFDPKAFQGGFNWREPYEAVLRIDDAGKLREMGMQVRQGQEACTVRFSDSGKLLSSLLTQAGRFTILAPHWLRVRLHQRLHSLLTDNFADNQGCDTICPALADTMIPEQRLGGIKMAKKLDVGIGMTWTTYIGSVDGALSKAGLWNDEIFKLMGMTGMAFHFIVHKEACPSSVTVYDWLNEHFAMLDRIGVHSDVTVVFRDPVLNTFPLIQEDAVAKIKASIDRGVPVVTWAPTGLLEFGLITGYDDEDKVLFVKDCLNPNPDPLLYTNLGVSEVPYLFIQVFKGKVDVDPEKIFRDSLKFGVGEWNKEHHVSPDYASGRKAYANLIGTLERGDFVPFGLGYNLSVYADSKECIARYLEFVSGETKELKGLEQAAGLYRQVADMYKEMTVLVPFSGPEGTPVDRSKVPALLELVRKCLDLEEQAMAVIEEALEQ